MTAPVPGSGARRLPVVLGALTVVVGFALGFGLAGRRTTSDVTAQGPTTLAAPAASEAPARTEPPPSSREPDTTSTVAVVSTSTSTSSSTTIAPAPTTVTTAAVPSTPPTTRAVVTTAAPVITTPAPPRVQVFYATDATGRLVVPRGGSAVITIANSGGLASQWLVTGAGFTTGGGPTQGTLEPGQSANVVIAPPLGALPAHEVPGTISVLGAINSTVPFVIPAA